MSHVKLLASQPLRMRDGWPSSHRPTKRSQVVASSLNPWATLGVPETADDEEVRRAYKRKALKLHPDVAQGGPEAHAKFVGINEAYKLLTSRKHRGSQTSAQGTSQRTNSWDMHDWYWTFVSSRWLKRKGAVAAAPHRAVSAPVEQLHGQLHELKRRAAARAAAPSGARRVYAHPERDEGEEESWQGDVLEASGQSPSQPNHPAPAHTAQPAMPHQDADSRAGDPDSTDGAHVEGAEASFAGHDRSRTAEVEPLPPAGDANHNHHNTHSPHRQATRHRQHAHHSAGQHPDPDPDHGARQEAAGADGHDGQQPRPSPPRGFEASEHQVENLMHQLAGLKRRARMKSITVEAA